jgi:hypothetical protein
MSELRQIQAEGKPMRVPKKLSAESAAIGAVFLLALTAGAMAQDSLSFPRDKLAIWAGHWKLHGEVKETEFAHARTFDYDVKCAFLPHGGFMACSSLSSMPDPNHGNRISSGASLFYYSDVDKTFKCTEVFPEGGPSEAVMLVDGNVWTKPLQIQRRSGGMAEGRFVYNFVSPDKILARFEISTDKGAHWTEVDEYSQTKIG